MIDKSVAPVFSKNRFSRQNIMTITIREVPQLMQVQFGVLEIDDKER